MRESSRWRIARSSPVTRFTPAALKVTAGQAFTEAVATFSDATGSVQIDSNTWEVDWPDGSSSSNETSPGSVTYDYINGDFVLMAHHLFMTPTDPASPEQLWVTVSDVYGGDSSTAVTTVDVLASPGAPTDLSATGGNAKVTLNWTGSSAAAAYNIYRSTTPGGEGAGTEGATPFDTTTDTSYEDDQVSPGVTYYYTVTAVNGADAPAESSVTSEVSAAPLPLAVSVSPIAATVNVADSDITVAIASANTNAQASDLSWNIDWADGTSSSGSNGDGITFDADTGLFLLTTSHTFTTATEPTSPLAVSISVSDGVNTVPTDTMADVYIAPDAPTDLSATGGNGSIALTWTDGGGTSNPAVAFYIYRSTTSGDEGSTPYDIAYGTAYEDDQITPGVSYYYTVTAINNASTPAESSATDEKSAASLPITLMLNPLTATVGHDTGQQPIATFTDANNTDGSQGTSYTSVINFNDGSGDISDGWVQWDDTTQCFDLFVSHTFSDVTDPANPLAMTLTITANDSDGNPTSATTATSTAEVEAAPDVPTNLAAAMRDDVDAAGDVTVSLSWTAVDDASGYIIERSAANSPTNFQEIDRLYGNLNIYYLDADPAMKGGTYYFYQVRAFNDAGMVSDPSYQTMAYTMDRPPVAEDLPNIPGQVITALPGQTITIPISHAYFDPDGTPVGPCVTGNTDHGGYVYSDGTSIQYTAPQDYAGIDTFLYFINNPYVGDSHTISVDVVAPQARADSNAFRYDPTGDYFLGMVDVNSSSAYFGLSYQVVDCPYGSLEFDNDGTGNFTYYPDGVDHGEFNIVYKVNQGFGDSNLATVLMTPDDPFMSGFVQNPAEEALGMAQGQTQTISTNLLNIGDADYLGSSITTELISADPGNPNDSGRTVTVNSDGSVTFTPDPNFSGLDWFTYQFTNGSQTTNYATAWINVQPVTVGMYWVDANGLAKTGEEDLALSDQTPSELNLYAPGANDPDYSTVPLGTQYTLSYTNNNGIPVNVFTDPTCFNQIMGLMPDGTTVTSVTWTQGVVPTQLWLTGGMDCTAEIDFVAQVPPVVGDPTIPSGPAPSTQPKATTQASVAQPINILIAFDGTGQETKPGTTGDIIQQFQRMYPKDGQTNFAEYFPGVATGGSGPLGYATGVGARGIIEDAQKKLMRIVEDPGVKAKIAAGAEVNIDIIGWSRGAFQAIKLADEICDVGGIKLSNGNLVKAKVRFLGLDSPVGQFNAFPLFPWRTDWGWQKYVDANVGFTAQAFDGFPNQWFFPETDNLEIRGKTDPPRRFDGVKHQDMGSTDGVLRYLIQEAKNNGVPVP